MNFLQPSGQFSRLISLLWKRYPANVIILGRPASHNPNGQWPRLGHWKAGLLAHLIRVYVFTQGSYPLILLYYNHESLSYCVLLKCPERSHSP